MTKPMSAASRANDWTFDMPAGLVAHVPTGLQFRLLPVAAGARVGNADEFARLQAAGWLSTGRYRLPPDVKDRREAVIAPGDANAPGAQEWVVLVERGAYERVGEALAMRHDPVQAEDMLRAICRDAGERWIFRARLERGWPDGRRAT